MKKIFVMLATVSRVWAEERAGAEPTKSVVQLQEDFRKLEFGMFIHYNMATYHGVQWVEGYPDPFYIWNDALDDAIMSAQEAQTFVRSLRPNIIASSNWWDWERKGTPFVDIAVKEVRHFPEANTAPGETCWKLEQKWFWGEGFRAGTAKGIMGHMTTAHARNSNFLLNVGPDRNGKIIESSIKTLAEIGTTWKPK